MKENSFFCHQHSNLCFTLAALYSKPLVCPSQVLGEKTSPPMEAQALYRKLNELIQRAADDPRKFVGFHRSWHPQPMFLPDNDTETAVTDQWGT